MRCPKSSNDVSNKAARSAMIMRFGQKTFDLNARRMRRFSLLEVKMQKFPEGQIRRFADQLWEKAGKPEGRYDEFRKLAEIELNAEGGNVPTDVGAAKTSDAG
jgi:hypothetical protein